MCARFGAPRRFGVKECRGGEGEEGSQGSSPIFLGRTLNSALIYGKHGCGITSLRTWMCRVGWLPRRSGRRDRAQAKCRNCSRSLWLIASRVSQNQPMTSSLAPY
jgi:hypothetical protein